MPEPEWWPRVVRVGTAVIAVVALLVLLIAVVALVVGGGAVERAPWSTSSLARTAGR
ncbi:hypothetical protein [Streptomyces sp. AJS327]|uniref:hypothetical protein n=1 Tax=Streptomyces sp. AJS327 TaxID=2545265 RepID=UPI0015DD6717|nr:hypothetical protein [Streptomyces sp. AJS327]